MLTTVYSILIPLLIKQHINKHLQQLYFSVSYQIKSNFFLAFNQHNAWSLHSTNRKFWAIQIVGNSLCQKPLAPSPSLVKIGSGSLKLHKISLIN
jgi:hypothetical protein